MVDQTKKDSVSKHGRSHEQNHSLANRTPSSGRSQIQDVNINDDLIVSLADAYENRRARQVNEWEGRQRAAAAF